MFIASLMINLINLIVGIVEAFIGLRIVLKLVAANPQTPFVQWIYETSRGLIWPFAGMFPSPTLEGGSIIEFNALIALLVYAFIGYLLMELVSYINYYSTTHYGRTRVVKKEVIED